MLRNEISNEKDLLNIKSLHITKSINLILSFLPGKNNNDIYKKLLVNKINSKSNSNEKQNNKSFDLKISSSSNSIISINEDKENSQLTNKKIEKNFDFKRKILNTPDIKKFSITKTEFSNNKITPFSEGKVVVNNSTNLFFIIQPFKCAIQQFFLPIILDINNNNNLLFYKIVSQNIFEITKKIEFNNKILSDFKYNIINEIKKIINEIFICNKENDFNLFIYGSFSNGLSIETSDIDLLITYNQKVNCNQILIDELSEKIEKSKRFKSIKKIIHTHVPIIKLTYEIINKKINKIGINEINIDISFQNIYKKKIIPSVLIVNYIKTSLNFVPGGKKIILILKKLLHNRNLNSYYNGGLSSFSIFLLVFSFFKYRISIKVNIKNDNFGLFLIQFLDFYSQFDFSKFGIDINKINPYFSLQFYTFSFSDFGGPVIIDPITKMNIGSNSFRIDDVKICFRNFKNNLYKLYEKDKKENEFFYLNIENYVETCLNNNNEEI